MFQFSSEQFRVKVGLAEMLKGGVIMDVTNAEQAKIAEDAGASAVMALERVPADIRKEGGVARMANIGIIEEIMQTVTIPVMAKARIGHFMEARILEALGVDYIDESEVLTPADEEHHIDKSDFKSPFVCGARNLGEALRRIGEGAAMIRTKGEAGSGNIVEAVRHIRTIVKEMKQLTVLGKEELMQQAKSLQAPLELVEWVAQHGKLPVPNFSAGGIATPADAALVMQLGAEAVFVGSGIFKSSDPGGARQRHRAGRQEFQQPREAAGSQPRAGRSHARPGHLQDARMRAAADPGLVMKKVGVLSLQGDFAAHGAALEARRRRARLRPRAAEQFARSTAWSSPAAKAPPCSSCCATTAYSTRWPSSAAASPSSAPAPAPSCWPTKSPNPQQESLGLMDIDVERNAYGRQIDSRVTQIEPEPEFAARTAPGKTGGGVHPRAHHPPGRRRRQGARPRTMATPCWWSRAATWSATFHPGADRRFARSRAVPGETMKGQPVNAGKPSASCSSASATPAAARWPKRFARTYGADVLIAASAGLAPAIRVAPDTLRAMAEKNIDLRDQFPKSLRHLSRAEFDLVVNLSGSSVPEDLASRTKVLEWEVDDPVFMKYDRHCEVRDQIEKLVMSLIIDLRRQAAPSRLRGQGSGRLEV